MNNFRNPVQSYKSRQIAGKLFQLILSTYACCLVTVWHIVTNRPSDNATLHTDAVASRGKNNQCRVWDPAALVIWVCGWGGVWATELALGRNNTETEGSCEKDKEKARAAQILRLTRCMGPMISLHSV